MRDLRLKFDKCGGMQYNSEKLQNVTKRIEIVTNIFTQSNN